MKQSAKILKPIILISLLVISISSCSGFSVAQRIDCYTPDRYLLDNEYGELSWSISHIYVPDAGGNTMLATASGALLVAVKSSVISNGIAAYDLRTGKYIWGNRSISPSILVADQNVVYEGQYEKIIILDAASGKSVDDVSLPGAGNIISFYRRGDTIFVFGSSGRFATYDLANKTMSITEPDFVKMIFIKEGNIMYSLDQGRVVAKDTNLGSVIWESDINESISIPEVTSDMIIFRTGDSTFDGNLYAINKKDGSIAWKKPGVISNFDVTDLGVYFLTTDGYLVVLNPQNGNEIAKMEFSSRPFELRYSHQELIGSYLIDVNQEKGVIGVSLGDSCQVMAIKINQ